MARCHAMAHGHPSEWKSFNVGSTTVRPREVELHSFDSGTTWTFVTDHGYLDVALLPDRLRAMTISVAVQHASRSPRPSGRRSQPGRGHPLKGSGRTGKGRGYLVDNPSSPRTLSIDRLRRTPIGFGCSVVRSTKNSGSHRFSGPPWSRARHLGIR